MHFVLILTTALTVCAQAAPQFNIFNLRNWRSKDILPQDQSQIDNENHNQNSDLIDQSTSSQLRFTGHRRSNDNGRQAHRNYGGSVDQCWDPVDHVYRDRSNLPSPHDNYPVQDNYDPSIDQNHHRVDHHRGPQFSLKSLSHRHGYGPPPSHHHYQYRPPPPHDHHHHHHHHHHPHGPPSHDHHHPHGPPPHHYEHGPPPHHHEHGPPTHHHYPYGPAPLPERPPRPSRYGNGNKLEICEDTSKESDVLEPVETSTLNYDSGVVDIPSSSPVPSSSTSPEDTTSEKSVTQSTAEVKSTTQFDWNSFFPEPLPSNTGGVGLIDVRMDAAEPV